MPNYEEMKNELSAIAEIVKQYPEGLQSQVFKVLFEEYMGMTLESIGEDSAESGTKVATGEEKPMAPRRKPSQKESYQIVSDLDLMGGTDRQPLRDFCKEKSPETAQDFNAVAVYYLQKILKVDSITLDHVYTCYKDTSTKMPGAFKQSLKDTAHRTGNIDTGDLGHIVITIKGENFVEHDLPKKKDRGEVA